MGVLQWMGYVRTDIAPRKADFCITRILCCHHRSTWECSQPLQAAEFAHLQREVVESASDLTTTEMQHIFRYRQIMKTTGFWNVMIHGLVDHYYCFRWTCHLHHQGRCLWEPQNSCGNIICQNYKFHIYTKQMMQKLLSLSLLHFEHTVTCHRD